MKQTLAVYMPITEEMSHASHCRRQTTQYGQLWSFMDTTVPVVALRWSQILNQIVFVVVENQGGQTLVLFLKHGWRNRPPVPRRHVRERLGEKSSSSRFSCKSPHRCSPRRYTCLGIIVMETADVAYHFDPTQCRTVPWAAKNSIRSECKRPGTIHANCTK